MGLDQFIQRYYFLNAALLPRCFARIAASAPPLRRISSSSSVQRIFSSRVSMYQSRASKSPETAFNFSKRVLIGISTIREQVLNTQLSQWQFVGTLLTFGCVVVAFNGFFLAAACAFSFAILSSFGSFKLSLNCPSSKERNPLSPSRSNHVTILSIHCQSMRNSCSWNLPLRLQDVRWSLPLSAMRLKTLRVYSSLTCDNSISSSKSSSKRQLSPLAGVCNLSFPQRIFDRNSVQLTLLLYTTLGYGYVFSNRCSSWELSKLEI